MIESDEWERVYTSQRRALLSYATLFLGSGPAAEDVVQDCITDRLAAPHLDVAGPQAYLWRTVTNRCRRRARRAKRRVRFDPDALAPWLDAPPIEMLDMIGRLTVRRRSWSPRSRSVR